MCLVALVRRGGKEYASNQWETPMKSWIAAFAVLGLAACSQPQEKADEAPAEVTIDAPSGAYTLDTNHSTVTVRALHFGLARYTLRFNGVSGALTFNAENPEQSTVEVIVATNTLDTPYLGDRDFDAELQNSEWLDTANHPTATFRSTAIERTGPNTARVTGDLTIRGVTRSITLDATYNTSHASHPAGFPGALIGFSARGTFLRSQYGLNVLQPSARGASDGVADEVELLVEAEFTQPAEEAAAPNPVQPAEPVN